MSTRNPPALASAQTRLGIPRRLASAAALQAPGAAFSTVPAPQAVAATETAATLAPQRLASRTDRVIAPKADPAPRQNVRPDSGLNPRPGSALVSAALAAALLLPAACAAAVTTAAAAPAGIRSPALSASDLDALLSRCAPEVAPATMRAIVKTESSGNPFAIGVVGGRLSRQPRSLAEALEAVRLLEARGIGYSAGLSQIYRKNFASLGLTPETAFSPCENLKAGARVLSRCYEDAAGSAAERLSAAFSCYYSGNPVRGRNLGYSERVAKNAGVAHPAFQPAFLPGAGQTPAWRPRAPPEESPKPAAPSASGLQGSKERDGQTNPAAPGSTQKPATGLSPAL